MADDAKAPGNRRERRAAAKSSSQSIAPPTKTPNIKMAHPDRSGPKGKTLLDLYDEKRDLLSQGQPFDPKHLDGAVRDEGGNILTAGLGSPDDEPIGVFGQAVFWSVCLAMFHFTMDVLTFNQYRQEIVWGPIWKRTFTVLPVLWLLVYITRSELAQRWQVARQVFFLGVAVAAGCYTIHVGNNFAYYAVMKQAPPLGTLWVWSVIEMQLPYAAASVLPVVAYLYFNGYAVF
ncbi:hypothetical protein B0A48_04632 [Cryoendolithus antarcticus]|uniref:DUF7719 domain-containing protein n=1 Tax=Cryoendolithus antarcticus TaxID=1507870 RepID=A0A1V8TG73_9PEZI|nr:hypothetical protein B0A48_04632 [Cryoendolithus antarcticus]OQO27396.1 hypothetical protein B0A51_05032 [Rachicladosporium sp. CCFEE 5018]